MSEVLERITNEIDARLRELRPQVEEIPRLEAALAALEAQQGRARARTGTQSDGGTRGRSSRGTTASGAPRKRAPRGQNRERVLKAIEQRPGASPGEIANASGVQRTIVYNLIRTLRTEGVVKRTDDGGVELR